MIYDQRQIALLKTWKMRERSHAWAENRHPHKTRCYSITYWKGYWPKGFKIW